MSVVDWGFHGAVPTASMFLFEADGVQIGMFSEVSGLEVRVEVMPYKEGGENGFEHKLPGRMSWPNIVLKRGVTDSDALFQWVGQTSGPGYASNNNQLSRTSGAITVVGSDGTRLRAWQLLDAFPVRWTGPRFTSGGNDRLDEELELAHHGFTSKTF